jgi:hypothetical protein
MAKIGIITYHAVANYGAAMQAWALQQYLTKLGHDVFLIDYRPSHLTSGGSFRWPKDAWSRRANLVIGYLKVMSLKKIFLGDGGKLKRFECFHREFFNLSSEVFRTNQALRKNPPQADAYICGSDQIWNASEQFGIDSSYFLDFAPTGVKRISYAASFGRPSVHSRFEAATATLVSEMDAVSVREQSAVKLVQELCGREAVWVPDPTLLVEDDYPDAVAPHDQIEDYIFSYTLRSRELVAAIESQLSRSTGLKVVSPLTLAADGQGEPGPLEWLGYIKSAKYVITNSYHGTLFSIIFRKPFVFVGLSGAKAAFNERANSLLNGLGLQDRMMDSYDEDALEAIIATDIDWSQVEAKLSVWRTNANRYLCQALQGD